MLESLILAVTWLIKKSVWDCCPPSVEAVFVCSPKETWPTVIVWCICARSIAASIKILPAATLNEIKKRQRRITRDLLPECIGQILYLNYVKSRLTLKSIKIWALTVGNASERGMPRYYMKSTGKKAAPPSHDHKLGKHKHHGCSNQMESKGHAGNSTHCWLPLCRVIWMVVCEILNSLSNLSRIAPIKLS